MKTSEKKYRELVELKGLIREKKTNYVNLAKELKMQLGTFSNKINGISVFTLAEAYEICKILEIPQERIYVYFF